MLVSVPEFRRYMGGYGPQEGQTEVIAMILQGVQEQLELWLNRPVEIVQIRENVRSDRQGYLHLSVTPVKKVISVGVTTAIDTLTPETEVKNPYTIVRDPALDDDARIIDKAYRSASTMREYGGLRVNSPCSWFTVEYLGGYDGIHDTALKLAIMRVAAREFRKNHIDTIGLREGTPDETDPGDDRNIGWTKDELTQLERIRRRVYL